MSHANTITPTVPEYNIDPGELLETLELAAAEPGPLYQNPRSIAALAEIDEASGFVNIRIRLSGKVYPPDAVLSLDAVHVSGSVELRWIDGLSNVHDEFVEQMDGLGLDPYEVIDEIIRLAHQTPAAQLMISRVEQQQRRIDAARRKLDVV